MKARVARLRDGVVTLTHNKYRSVLRVIPDDKRIVGLVKEYDYASADRAEREFEALIEVAGAREGDR